ncbi:MAG TPA: DUF3352 domain-containing protein, partial [Pyrinomonadaceae bacterium]
NVYVEVRGVGQLMRSEGVKDLLEPVTKLAAPPKEFKSLVKWLNSHADALMTARLMFAAWPARAKLPQYVVAIEFSSAEEAQKFDSQLKEFLPKLLPAPAAETAPHPNTPRAGSAELKQNEKPPAPPYVLRQVGALIFISDVPFTLKDLKPAGSRLLAEDQNFRLVHDRFTSEPIVLYVNLTAFARRESEREQKAGEQQQQTLETTALQKTESDSSVVAASPELSQQPEPSPESSVMPVTTDQTAASLEPVVQSSPEGANTKEPNPIDTALVSISSAFFGGQPKWPEAIGAAIVFEGDSYVARVLLVNKPEVKGGPLPFFPHFVSGPALTPESPTILPGDTELFVSASLDFPLIYEGIVKTANDQSEQMQRYNTSPVKNVEPVSPFEAYEKKLGIKIKEDLLPLLGNEVAFTIPVRAFGAGPSTTQTASPSSSDDEHKQKQATPETPSPVFAFALKDRQAVRALLPKIVDSLGVKGASLLAQTEKRDDTELVSYGDAFAYAFIGDFLVFSPDARVTHHVVDSYLSHDTLASSTNFRNYTRWQPRQVLGQVYVSPALMETYNVFARDAAAQLSEQLRDFLLALSPVAQPVTYAISNEGMGPLHELHVPRNLVMLIVAGISSEANESPVAQNEAIARSALRTIASAEATYQATEGAGRYGNLDELIKTGLISKDFIQNYGYRIELTVSNTRFEVVAVPTEYGKTGKLSFFLDDSSVLRAGDHAGEPATIADKPGD